jgi:hypothetical protein
MEKGNEMKSDEMKKLTGNVQCSQQEGDPKTGQLNWKELVLSCAWCLVFW